MEAMNNTTSRQSPFKVAEKKIRSCQHLSEALADGSVLDFLNPNVLEDHSDVIYSPGNVHVAGKDKPFYSFRGYEGLFLIPDCLPAWQQVEISHFALSRAPCQPNNTNLSPSEVEDVWQKERHLYDSMGPEAESYRPLSKSCVLGRLRWASLGLQYDWTNRKYPQAQAPTHLGSVEGDTGNSGPSSSQSLSQPPPPEFPPRLASIISDLAAAVPPSANTPPSPISIRPEASIVNYFPAGSTMGGHVDDAELTYDHPVVSLSLGRSCVFLIGGRNKETPPLGMVLRSGYVLLMHGGSRLRMHGVAKVFACPCGDPSKAKRAAGAAKRGRWPVCQNVCCSFDRQLDPETAINTLTEPEPNMKETECIAKKEIGAIVGDEHRLHCHDNLGGVECAQHQTKGGREEEVCTSCLQRLLPGLEVQRILRFLKTSRININVRQVFPSASVDREKK